MNVLKRFYQYKIYRRIIISYLLLLILTISLISAILFSMFSSSTVKEIGSNSKAMLSQTSYASDVIYNQVMNIAKQLTLNNDVVSFLYSGSGDKLSIYNASLSLTHILATYPFIKYIELVNLINGNYYNTLPISLDLIQKNKTDTLNLLAKTSEGYFTFTPRMQFLSSDSTIRTLSFIFRPDFLNANNRVILINIDEQYIQNTIKNLSRSSNTFVMDSSGTVLSHTDITNFMSNLSGKSYVKDILSSLQSQGGGVRDIDGEKNLVTYAKSDAMDWYFVSITPYQSLLGNIDHLRNVTLLTGFVLFLFGIAVSLLLTSSIYNPMKALIEKVKPTFYRPVLEVQDAQKAREKKRFDEYKILSEIFSSTQETFDSLRSSILQSSAFIREKYVMNLLKGNLSTISASEELLSEMREQFTGPCYCVFVLKIDRYKDFKKDTGEEDLALLRLSLCKTAHEALSGHYRNDVTITEENEIAVIAQFETDIGKEDLLFSLMELQNRIKNDTQLMISAGIGDIVLGERYVAASYQSAREYIKYRFFSGAECIADQTAVEEHNAQICKYPSSCEVKILKALQLGSRNQVNKACEDFIKRIRKASYYQTINYTTQLMLSIIRNFQDSLNLIDEDYKSFYGQVNQLSSLETIHETLEELKSFCTKILQLQEDKYSNVYTKKHVQLVEEIKDYVLQHYSDPSLSLDTVADIVKLSSGYLGKLFKNIANISFSDYLTAVRLEKSKDLLATTCVPASKICENVGIYNASYFFTLFKKSYGMTPSQFREQNIGK